MHSGPGRSEQARPNNHGAWHDAQVASLAIALGMDELAAKTVRDSLRRIETQFLADGRQPEELRRTKAIEYSHYNLRAWRQVAALGQRFGIGAWSHRNTVGASPAAGLSYLEVETSRELKSTHPQNVTFQP